MLDWGVLSELNVVSIIFRVFLAMLIGGILGIERGRKSRPAGFRTYILVCLGSALVMMTNQYVSQMYGEGDPTRLGAQVISGIGFLGAGTIILTHRNQVTGMTTAAGLWSAACLGLAIGIGFYEGALIAGLSVLMIMTIFQRMDQWLAANAKVLHVYIAFETAQYFNRFMDYCGQHGIKVQNIEISKGKVPKKSGFFTILSLENRTRIPHTETIRQLGALEGVVQIEEL